MNLDIKICTRCVMDETDPEIQFSAEGVCNHCTLVREKLTREPFCLSPQEKTDRLAAIVARVKRSGKNKKYDCIIGLSGGVDSSYVALKVKEMGLRPLAVHLDNGWDSELAVKNIENICSKLNIDLFTYVIDWEEFKDLQLSFLKASTPDSEIPSDHAIVSILYKMASQYRVRHIIGGTNTASESIMPRAWSQGHPDWTYIKNLQRRFGTVRLKSFPHRSYVSYILNRLFGFIRWIDFLDNLEYHREEAKAAITERLGWRDYGRKHGESTYTRFFQEYILPRKFGFDKRKAHYSSLIMAGQMTRPEALARLQEPLYDDNRKIEEDINYVSTKFGLSRAEFDAIMNLPAKSYWDYPNFQRTLFYRAFRALYYSITGSRP
jgi:N-acetyl sugar amidotransferase